MAEKGAYLTGTSYIRPSIFELIAQESLSLTLEPAFKKIFSFFVSFNPERYGHFLQWADEGYLIFNVMLQRYYMKKYSASFSETFYGLKRVSLSSGAAKDLSKRQEQLSWLLIVLFPYIKNKLSKLCQKYELEEADGHVPQSKWEKLYRVWVIRGYKTTFMLYEFTVLYNYILYLSGKSKYTSPLLRLLSVSLTYANTQAIISISDLLGKIKTNSFGLNDGIDILERVFTKSLEFGAFFLQFLAWWSQDNYYMNLMKLPVPPPPTVPKVAEKYKGICPICLKSIHIHTVLPVSGYAFCYRCILPVIRESGKCPVTSYPAREDDLIRLYLE